MILYVEIETTSTVHFNLAAVSKNPEVNISRGFGYISLKFCLRIDFLTC